MKIVINKCYGGFGLSAMAVKRLTMSGSVVIESSPLEEWGDLEGCGNLKFEREDIGNGFFVFRFGTITRGNEVYTLKGKYDHATRTHPDVIDIIEELGRDADGDCAKLEIVEIPDGIDWEIEEYDGIEWISESHRTWR